MTKNGKMAKNSTFYIARVKIGKTTEKYGVLVNLSHKYHTYYTTAIVQRNNREKKEQEKRKPLNSVFAFILAVFSFY